MNEAREDQGKYLDPLLNEIDVEHFDLAHTIAIARADIKVSKEESKCFTISLNVSIWA